MQKVVEDKLGAIEELCRRYAVRRLDLFGSGVRDDFQSQTSDLDFLVEFSDYTPENAADRFLGLLVDLEDLFERKIDLVSSKAIRNPYFRQVVDSTKVSLYAA